MAKLLVTGAAGRVGSRIVPLLAQNHDLRLTDIRKAEDTPHEFMAADITHFVDTVRLMEGIDAVVHLAIASGNAFPPQETMPPSDQMHPYDEAMLEINAKGSLHLYESARRAGIRKFVYMSSLTIMKGHKREDMLKPDLPPEPFNLYACTKLFGEHVGQLYARKHGMSVTCLRLGQPFPLGLEVEKELVKHPEKTAIFAGCRDIAQGIECALRLEKSFSVYNLISHSKLKDYNTAEWKELGYEPREYYAGGSEMSLLPGTKDE